MHGRNCISFCLWVGWLHRVARVLIAAEPCPESCPGCFLRRRAQGWRAVISGHTTFTHLALVLSGETAKYLILSFSCSDPVNDVTESPVLNPLEAILVWFYIVICNSALKKVCDVLLIFAMWMKTRYPHSLGMTDSDLLPGGLVIGIVQ